MLIIAADLAVPPLGDLLEAGTTNFAPRHIPWPPQLNPPPRTWTAPWAAFVRGCAIAYTTLETAYAAFVTFWAPVLSTSDRYLTVNRPGNGDRPDACPRDPSRYVSLRVARRQPLLPY